MIHATNGRKANEQASRNLPAVAEPTAPNTFESRVKVWITQYPEVSIGLAVLAGLGIGFLIKRKLM